MKKSSVIDLTQGQDDAQRKQAQRDELTRVDNKIEALVERRNTLRAELGISTSGSDFLDTNFDAFAKPAATAAIDDIDVADEDFDKMYEAFAAADAAGDDKARRWFDSV